MGSSGGLTRPHRLLPFLRFSTLYPKMLVPPVLEGADQARLIQSLKALSIFGVEGGPGYAKGKVKIIINLKNFSTTPPILDTLSQIDFDVLQRQLTLCPCLNVIGLHHFTDALISFSPDVIAVLSAMIHISVPVFSLRANFAQFLPAVSANLLALQDVVSDRGTSVVFRRPPFELNTSCRTFDNILRT